MSTRTLDMTPELLADESIEYREIPECPGYRFGNDGSVWCCKSTGYGYGRIKPWKRLRAAPDRAGRPCVSISVEGKVRRRMMMTRDATDGV